MTHPAKAAAALWTVFLAACLLPSALVAARTDRPIISVTDMEMPPFPSYFKGSDVVMSHDPVNGDLIRSVDGGATWSDVDDIPPGAVTIFIMHEFDDRRAYAIANGFDHYMTKDRGETWQPFSSGMPTTLWRDDILRFHADDPDRIIFHGMICDGRVCSELTTYTTDGFRNVDILRVNTDFCWWAKASKSFTTGDEALDRDRTMCLIRDAFSGLKEKQRLVISDEFFQRSDDDIQEYEPNLDTDRPVQGVVNVATAKKFLVAATVSLNTAEMALFVTQDSKTWHRAMFPLDHGHRIHQDSYTILEGTEYSIQVDVEYSHPLNPLGVLFSSNSNGTYFTENVHDTNRNSDGRVDFEKISGIQGVFLVNFVENGKEVEERFGVDKKVVSEITFDDGRTFEKVYAGDQRIHLHSVTQLDNIGKVFSSPAPGLVMGNGNTGSRLESYKSSSLYVSDDAGLTWKEARKGPHKYQFGDQGSILIAVRDSLDYDISEIAYSLNHGDKWETVDLPDGLEIQPLALVTSENSSGLKFIIIGRSGDDEIHSYKLISIDFAGLHERTCTEDDMMDWPARVDHDGKPTCVMGHKQVYKRRRKDAECFLNQPFEIPVPVSEVCECSDVDFECDYNFVRDKSRECRVAASLAAPEGACGPNARDGDTFRGPSGWRKISGNQCRGGKKKDEPVDRSCQDASPSPDSPASDQPENSHKLLAPGFNEIQYIYLERGDSSQTTDETVLARAYKWTVEGTSVDDKIWRTTDHGKTWEHILKDEHIVGIFPHQYLKDIVFFTTFESKRVIYTVDRGLSFHEFEAPQEPADYPFAFHPDKRDWLIWIGQKLEKVGDRIVTEAWLSTSRGDEWKAIHRAVERCEFTGHSEYYNLRSKKQIVCLVRESEDGKHGGPMMMVGSEDFFVEDTKELVRNVVDFATQSEFIVAAVEDSNTDNLKALTSIDGTLFEDAKFPSNSKVPNKREFTVLDSSSHSVRMFVATETAEGHRYGSILKSNSNGTSYVRIAEAVNCNERYYVDFEKINGLEGVLVINTVVNRDQVGEAKRLRTKVSHNDGAEWGYLPPPKTDRDGKPYACSSDGGDEQCALHIHHYTEREDKAKTFSAATAVGFMFAIGNVGAELEVIENADTFLTTDAGLTWKNVAKGPWAWQFGDQGSLLVLVQKFTQYSKVTTKTVLYSTDEGETWSEHRFSDQEVEVVDLTALRSGSSRNFLLWVNSAADGGLVAVNLDFQGIYDGPCGKPGSADDGGDYDLWSPKHPLHNDNCLFGHVSEYYRKKKGRRCYNEQTIDHLLQISNCECSRRDYECDYNFELSEASGECVIVPGHQALPMEEWCETHPNASTWYEPRGYRKLPLSTCQGGKEFDKASRAHACPGHEDEFEKAHATSGAVVFFAVVIPFAAAAAVGWWVWRNWSGKFGQIRLGEDGGNRFESDGAWAKYPVMAIAAAVAALSALPLLATALWRRATSAYRRVRGDRDGSGSGSGSGGGGAAGGLGRFGGLGGLGSSARRFTTRDSFARGRGDYAMVDEDEGELLGDESDEEV